MLSVSVWELPDGQEVIRQWGRARWSLWSVLCMTHTAETRCARCSADQMKQLRRHPNASYSLLTDRVGILQKGIIILPTSLPAGFLTRALLGFSSYRESLWICGSLLGSFLTLSW